MKPRHRRLLWIAAGVGVLAIAAGLILNAFQANLVFFFSPSQVLAREAPAASSGRSFRIGGLVEAGSLQRDNDGLTSRFRVTDLRATIPVAYTGILPDLFKEGRGCVAQGHVGNDGVFYAESVLAKHDENYMPPEAAQSIEKAKRSANEAAKTLSK